MSYRTEGKGREWKGREGNGEASSCEKTPEEANGHQVDLKVRNWLEKTKNLKTLSQEKNADLWSGLERAYDSYPWLYFEEEINKADAWITANPQRAPTPNGLPRFMRNWLERAVEIGRRRQAGAKVQVRG